MKKPIRVKLGILIGILLLLILIVGLTAFFQTSRINAKVNEIANVEHKTSETAYQMELNLMETGVAVLKYLNTNSPEYLTAITDGDNKFQIFQKKYVELEQTDRISSLGTKVKNTHQQFTAVVDSLIKKQNAQNIILASWEKEFDRIYKILENETYEPEKRFDAHKDLKMRASLKVQAMKANVNRLRSDLGNYLKTQQQEYETAMRIDQKNFTDNFNSQQLVARPERKEKFAVEIKRSMRTIRTLTDSLVNSEKVKQITLLSFGETQKEFSSLLEEQVLILANKNLIAAKNDALQVAHNSNIIISLLLIVTLLFGSITGFLFTRNITKPLKELMAATNIVAENDFSKRVHIHSRDELETLANSFNQMTEQLQIAKEKQAALLLEIERSNKELEDFAHVVSHDLKAPLRGIHTVSEWLSDGFSEKLGQEGIAQLDLIRNRAKKMSEMIDGILRYSKVVKSAGQKEKIELNNFVKEVTRLIGVPAHIRLDIQDNLPVITFERIRLQQVFQNLLSNAIKYMDKEIGSVKISCTSDDIFWKFCIFDNGPGIEERFLKSIFKLFQTIKPKDERESTGVGLAIVHKIVEDAGGKIWVESKTGEGSSFYFTLLKDNL